MSVGDNLLMGAYARRDRRRGSTLLLDRADVLRRFPVLGSRLSMGAGLLSGGEQQMLAIGRALMAKPRLLMLDEPSLGLAPRIVEQVFRVIQELRDNEGLTILLVEQKARQALTVADRAYVLDNGRIAAQGSAAAIAGGSLIEDVFLGRSPNPVQAAG
jgi:branched-chain amino acid transport system ATP-binding protein